MTRRPGGDLGSVLGNLRRGRTGGEVQELAPAAPKTRRGGPEQREPFTSRLLPSQRRFLKRLTGDWEEEAGRRVTVEDILNVMVQELEENEAMRERLVARLAGKE